MIVFVCFVFGGVWLDGGDVGQFQLGGVGMWFVVGRWGFGQCQLYCFQGQFGGGLFVGVVVVVGVEDLDVQFGYQVFDFEFLVMGCIMGGDDVVLWQWDFFVL